VYIRYRTASSSPFSPSSRHNVAKTGLLSPLSCNGITRPRQIPPPLSPPSEWDNEAKRGLLSPILPPSEWDNSAKRGPPCPKIRGKQRRKGVECPSNLLSKRGGLFSFILPVYSRIQRTGGGLLLFPVSLFDESSRPLFPPLFVFFWPFHAVFPMVEDSSELLFSVRKRRIKGEDLTLRSS